MTRLMLRFDMRRPAFATSPQEEHYAAALEMATWADEHDFTSISLSEHHAVPDGYLPSPLIAIALPRVTLSPLTTGGMARTVVMAAVASPMLDHGELTPMIQHDTAC
jgi:hypothetical protein